jgi:hypothetical protein
MWRSAATSRHTTQFTFFNSTKVQMLTHVALCSDLKTARLARDKRTLVR